MKVAGIVCEYNPMHNGHVWQIEKTREAGATHVVCVMSGNFVQRGEPSFADKQTRADIAVHCGADLVIDLPVPWSCDSAENFAFGAVSLLDSLGIDLISFGTEISDVDLLKKCACCIDDPKLGSLIKKKSTNGLSYPAALNQAIEEQYGKQMASVVSSPNSTLALEYIRALNRLGSSAEICAVERNSCAHDSSVVSDGFASAAAIRQMKDYKDAEKYMPEYAFKKISEVIENGYAVNDSSEYERMVLSALRMMSLGDMQRIICDESGITQRIYSSLKTSASINGLLESAKTKSITMARLRRCIMRLFLKIPYDISKKNPPYIRVLAANRKGLEILSKDNIKLPVVTKHSDISKLGKVSQEVYDLQCRSTDLYMLMAKKIRACSVEQISPVIIVK